MKFYYIANARMPTEKAHGIQIAKMCEAYIEAGIDLTLVVPNRITDPVSLKEYYGLRVPVKIIRLPAIDRYTSGRIGYLISTISFMFSYLIFLLWKKIIREKFIIYTIDIDNYSSSALALLAKPIFSEMHGSKMPTIAQRILFKYLNGVIAINKIIIKELKDRFSRSLVAYIAEPNGVDLAQFTNKISKREARIKLGLPENTPIVLYAGRFFEWKGLEIIPAAAALTPQIRWQTVGGIKADFEKLVKRSLPSNLFFAGGRPHSEMSIWFAAADSLLVLGTIRDIQSYRYTSPMKLFEYMASGRAIIASGTPAIREVVNAKEVLFYEPDEAKDLARVAKYSIEQSKEIISMIETTTKRATECSWRARAERIVRFINENISH